MPIPTVPALSVVKTVPRSTDVLVVGFVGEDLVGVPDPVSKAYAKKSLFPLNEMARSLGMKSAEGTTRTLPPAGDGPRIVAVGLGDEPLTPEDLRKAAAVGIRYAGELAKETPLSASVSLGADEPEEVEATAEGALLGSYSYVPISSKPAKEGGIDTVSIVAPKLDRGTNAAQLAQTATIVAEAVLTAREWVNIPPNLLYPESFAEEARALVKNSKVTISVMDDKALSAGGYGGLMGVGGGSSRLPRLVRLSYAPRGASFHLVLVGKGITFDSGGVNIKPASGMYTMKCDMAGAAAVLAATHAIARLGMKIKVTTYAALAENMPSATAYRPSDVLTMYGGKTVENGNTDAEGRLVMADALARANEDKPDLVVDVATLTGACVVALGNRTAGLMATDDDTADRILDAAEASGEGIWQLPIPKDTRSRLDSQVADLRSMTAGDNSGGGALVAAAFLREFVEPPTPWAHIDIAGPGFHDNKPYGYVSSGGTGVGVRTLVSLARSLS